MSYTEDLQSIEVGQRLCVTGSGSDRMAHRHVKVTGFTQQWIKSTYRFKGQTIINRHRRDDGSSVPYVAYGGTHVHVTCQRPEDGLRSLTTKERNA
jgi:hypothetical protein